jgi:hypothetical protein
MRSSKTQVPNTKEAPIFQAPIFAAARYCDLVIEVSLGFGVWDLALRWQ